MADHDEARARLAELLKGVRTVMLTTVDENGRLTARPMAVQDTEFDGNLWLIAGKDSEKVREIHADAHVGVVSMARDTWLSIDGTAELVDDRARIHEFWNPFVQAWFPDGPDDPNVTLIKVVGQTAEYWDASGSRVATGLKMLRSAVTGNPPTDVGDNETLDLPS